MRPSMITDVYEHFRRAALGDGDVGHAADADALFRADARAEVRRKMLTTM